MCYGRFNLLFIFFIEILLQALEESISREAELTDYIEKKKKKKKMVVRKLAIQIKIKTLWFGFGL